MAPSLLLRDATNESIVGWVPDPNGRGTSGLIISCLLTLGLCVWSALHLNIPAKEESHREYWLRRVKWAACGVLLPELVVLLAWRQWTSAGRLTKEINKVYNDVEYRSVLSKASSKSLLDGDEVGLHILIIFARLTASRSSMLETTCLSRSEGIFGPIRIAFMPELADLYSS